MSRAPAGMVVQADDSPSPCDLSTGFIYNVLVSGFQEGKTGSCKASEGFAQMSYNVHHLLLFKASHILAQIQEVGKRLHL